MTALIPTDAEDTTLLREALLRALDEDRLSGSACSPTLRRRWTTASPQ